MYFLSLRICLPGYFMQMKSLNMWSFVNSFFYLVCFPRFIHVLPCISTYSFYYQITFHYVDIPHFVHPSSVNNVLFLLFGYYELCCSEHLCTGFCVAICYFSWVLTTETQTAENQRQRKNSEISHWVGGKFTYSGIWIRITADFLSEIMKSRREWSEIFKVLK